MVAERQRQRVNHLNEDQMDRLSSLPDDVLALILSKTQSYKLAVKCSTISKRLGKLYTLLPSLTFSFSETRNHSKDDLFEYENIVSTALMRHHRDGLQSIVLDVLSPDSLNTWLRFLSMSEVSKIHLNFNTWACDTWGNGYEFPSEFLSWSVNCLTEFSMSNLWCDLLLPPSFLGFPCLTLFELSGMRVGKWIERVVSNSPLLMSLTIVGCSFPAPVVISSDSVATMSLMCCCKWQPVDVHCPNLTEFSTTYRVLEKYEEKTPDASVLNLTLPNPRPSLWNRVCEKVNHASLVIDFEPWYQLDHYRQYERQQEKDWRLFKKGEIHCKGELKKVQTMTIKNYKDMDEYKWFACQVLDNSPDLTSLVIFLEAGLNLSAELIKSFYALAKRKRSTTTIRVNAFTENVAGIINKVSLNIK